MKPVTLYLEESLVARIDELAQAENRSRANFMEQFLHTHLSGKVDRAELSRRMNPALSKGLVDSIIRRFG